MGKDDFGVYFKSQLKKKKKLYINIPDLHCITDLIQSWSQYLFRSTGEQYEYNVRLKKNPHYQKHTLTSRLAESRQGKHRTEQ